MQLLNEAALREGLDAIPDWSVRNDALFRTLQFERYLDGLAFVEQVATAAETLNHHPEITLRWGAVDIQVTTHDAGGLTELDVVLALTVDKILGQPDAHPVRRPTILPL